MKEAAGYISRLICQIAGRPATTSSTTTEASCVAVRDKVTRSSSNGLLAAFLRNRRLRAHALLCVIACTSLAVTGCGGHGKTNPPLTIGPAGGNVTEASGAKVVIPAGALTQDIPIAVT